MATEIWVNIGSGNGLLPDGTKPLPEPMLTDHQWSPVTSILGPSVNKICLKITCLKFHSNFPGDNELSQYWGCWWHHFLAPCHQQPRYWPTLGYIPAGVSRCNCVVLSVADTMYDDFVLHPKMTPIRDRTVWVHVNVPGQEPDSPDLPARYVHTVCAPWWSLLGLLPWCPIP